MAGAEDRPGDRPQGQGAPARKLRAQSQREFELEFFGRLLDFDPFHAAALRVHGNNLSASGQYSRALQVDRRLVRLQPDRPIPWYNLACSYARMGMLEPAFAALQRSLEIGYRRLDHLMRDPDLKPLRADRRFARLIRRGLRSED